ncbi:hypothetical protein K469DRAFT_522323, partial [Zopfia rhizophila CBS 207.26]
TLQGLIAPDYVDFHTKEWKYCGSRDQLAGSLHEVTNIDCRVLALRSSRQRQMLSQFSIATRMSWASKRVTSRPEDIAYCLFGIFDVNMPLLYGDGAQKAFARLQEEILRCSVDRSILAW